MRQILLSLGPPRSWVNYDRCFSCFGKPFFLHRTFKGPLPGVSRLGLWHGVEVPAVPVKTLMTLQGSNAKRKRRGGMCTYPKDPGMS